MLRCISKDYPNDLPFHQSPSPLFERTRLLSALLSSRRALRVICAPAGYGKTVIAYQYASQFFAPDDVRWIDASQPAFLVALDTQPSNEFMIRFLDRDTAHYKSLLFVIDSCPVLDTERIESLCSLVVDLMNAGHEVLLTTRDVRWLDTGQPVCTCLDARMLLLDSHEHTCILDHVSIADGLMSENDRVDDPLLRIVGFATQGHHGHECFVRAMLDYELVCEEDALSIIMLVLERGTVQRLQAFTKCMSQTLLMHFAHRYPHVGIAVLNPMFNAIKLSDQEKFQLISTHIASIVKLLACFKDENAFLKALIEALIGCGQVMLATQLTCGLHEDSWRASYFDDHARPFLFEGHPLALLHLAATLPESHIEGEHRWLDVAIALGILGEKDACLHILAKYPQKKRVRCSSQVQDAQTVFIEEAIALLVKIAFNIAEPHDQEILSKNVDAYLKHHASITSELHKRPDFACELFLLVQAALEDPSAAFSQLRRIAAAGFSLKHTLTATCIFVAMIAFIWRDRFDRDRSDMAKSTSTLKDPCEEEKMMLADLEGHIALILSRQTEVLPTNMCALFLFDRARDLFGERAYLLVDDRTLAHIEALRTDLVSQQSRWRTDRHVSFLVDQKPTQSAKKECQRKALRINTLGRFELTPNDPRITIKDKVRKQMRLLISLLAINEGREIARQRIQQIMWPDASERNARQSLYTMWSLLNKSILDSKGECPFFESHPTSIALNASLVETDTQLLSGLCKHLREDTLELADYERAIDWIEELYRGPLLPGDETAEVVSQRKRYQDRLLEALLTSGTRLRKRGETTLALRYFRFAFDTEPTREDICYQLMLSLWKLGRHGEALNEYFVCRRSLIDQFGIEGTSKLRELYELILSDASE